jgi:hypothetical protein
MDQSVSNDLPIANYQSELPVRAGLLAGVVGSLAIMVVVTALLIITGRDIWTAARLIATVVYGPEASEGFLPIVIGTIIHLVTGGVLGAIFGRIMPSMPRGFWLVPGLMYGVAAWILSSFVILPVVAPSTIQADANIEVLLLAHVVYGLTLGLAGASYGLWWHLPSWLESGTENR